MGLGRGRRIVTERLGWRELSLESCSAGRIAETLLGLNAHLQMRAPGKLDFLRTILTFPRPGPLSHLSNKADY